jgi:hypothetical protein
MDLTAPKYSDKARLQATALMDALRDRVVLPADAIKDWRFRDNQHTLWVLESQATEEQFNEDPSFEVTRALVESARSDHWYKFEKKWDCDYGTNDDYDENSYED